MSEVNELIQACIRSVAQLVKAFCERRLCRKSDWIPTLCKGFQETQKRVTTNRPHGARGEATGINKHAV